MKKKQIFICFIAILVIGIIVWVGYQVLYQDQEVQNEDKNNENISTSKEDIDNLESDDDINIDYDAVEMEIINRMNTDSNMKAYLSTCEDIGNSVSPDFQTNDIVLSINTVHTVIEKLKTATSVEKIPTSLFCPEYTFVIKNDSTAEILISVNYADNKSVLLVGIKDEGYAFHFATENELSNFLEELK